MARSNSILLALLLAAIGFSRPAQAFTIAQVYKDDLINYYCAGLVEDDAVDCLDELLSALKEARKDIRGFETAFNQIRGPLPQKPTRYSSCSTVTVNGRSLTSSPSRSDGRGVCARDWDKFAAAMDELMHEACVVKWVYRDSDKRTRLTAAAEQAENKYNDCFVQHWTVAHSVISSAYPINTPKDFFEEYETLTKEYELYDLNGQAQAAFRACKTAIAAVAARNRRKADNLLKGGKCQ